MLIVLGIFSVLEERFWRVRAREREAIVVFFLHGYLSGNTVLYSPNHPLKQHSWPREQVPPRMRLTHTFVPCGSPSPGGRLCRRAIAERLRRAFTGCGHVMHVHVSMPDGADNSKNGSIQAQVGKRATLGSRFAHVRCVYHACSD